MTRQVVIGTRGSDLALWQANFVRDSLVTVFPEREFEVKVIRTTGDQVLDVSLSKIGDKGLFTRQIEDQLLSNEIDLAVHSLKDLPTALPSGLKIGAVCKREKPNDALISKTGAGVADLPKEARVATGSLRRKSQLLATRPDLEIIDIRGNVPTRLRKFDESDWDGLILAYAGLERLGYGGRISQVISSDILLPAVGQGAVAIEVRANDDEIAHLVSKLIDIETSSCVTAERSFLRRLEGGCQIPIGALGTIKDNELVLSGFVGSLDGASVFRDNMRGNIADAETIGKSLAEKLLSIGAGDVLKEARAA